ADARAALARIAFNVRDAVSVRRLAVSQLSQMSAPGDAERNVLRRALSDDDASVRETAVRGVATIKDTASAAPIATLASSSTERREVRIAALDALSVLEAPQFAGVLRQPLKDPDPAVRRQAAVSLRRLGPSEAATVDLLDTLANDPDTSVREAA